MPPENRRGRLFYHRLPDFDRKETKLEFLSQHSLSSVDWQRLVPNAKHTWRRTDTEDEFASIPPHRQQRSQTRQGVTRLETIFKLLFWPGVKTNRDVWAYGL